MSSDTNHHTNTKGNSSFVSTNTVQENIPFESVSSPIISMDTQSASRSFGSELQKYSKDLIKSLSNFKFSKELTDENYNSWSQAVSELFRSIDLDQFITVSSH